MTFINPQQLGVFSAANSVFSIPASQQPLGRMHAGPLPIQPPLLSWKGLRSVGTGVIKFFNPSLGLEPWRSPQNLEPPQAEEKSISAIAKAFQEGNYGPFFDQVFSTPRATIQVWSYTRMQTFEMWYALVEQLAQRRIAHTVTLEIGGSAVSLQAVKTNDAFYHTLRVYDKAANSHTNSSHSRVYYAYSKFLQIYRTSLELQSSPILQPTRVPLQKDWIDNFISFSAQRLHDLKRDFSGFSDRIPTVRTMFLEEADPYHPPLEIQDISGSLFTIARANVGLHYRVSRSIEANELSFATFTDGLIVKTEGRFPLSLREKMWLSRCRLYLSAKKLGITRDLETLRWIAHYFPENECFNREVMAERVSVLEESQRRLTGSLDIAINDLFTAGKYSADEDIGWRLRRTLEDIELP